MKEAEAMKMLDAAATSARKMEAFRALSNQIGAPTHTIYSWWRKNKIPAWRLAAFDVLARKPRKAA